MIAVELQKAAAKRYLAAGLSIIPVYPADHPDPGKRKKPTAAWKKFQTDPAKPEDIDRLFSNGANIAVLGGAVSGNVEIIDFDEPKIFPEFMESLRGHDAALADKLLQSKTPSGGYHLIYRCKDAIPGNQKLAMAADGKQVLIETRGQGGYALVAPSTGYTILHGDISNMPVISQDERNLLHYIATIFDDRPPKTQKNNSTDSSDRPGDVFNKLASLGEMLWEDDWKHTSFIGNRSHYTRPGKDDGSTSATLHPSKGLYVWSTSTQLPAETPLDPFGYLTHFRFSGDFTAAAKWVRKNYPNEFQKEIPKTDLLTAEECRVDNLTLQIPPAVSNPGGLISLGMAALSMPGMAAIEQYNLAVILTTLANAIAPKVSFRGGFANLFNVKIGPTSTGKTEGDKRVKAGINGAGIGGFYGPSDFASGPALLRALADIPRCLVVIDEATPMLRRTGKADTVADGKRDALLELFSASGQTLTKAYSDKRNNIVIENPCLSLTANCTTDILNHIEHKDFVTGLMQRFDFWCYDGETPKRGRAVDTENVAMTSFVEGIRAIFESGSVIEAAAVPLAITPEADDRLFQWSNTIIDRVNSADDDGEKGIISRAYDLAIKYSLVHLAATRTVDRLTAPLEIENIEYGIAVAWMLADWKINRLRNRISYGDFDRDAEMFKEGIRRAMEKGRRPTLAMLVDRVKPLRNLPSSYITKIVETLVSRNEISIDTTGRAEAFYLVRQK